ncbi:MAG TPA: hypothetical protein VGS12_16415 [Caulobacteraceae bacterium]|nr:hypothetical protein [Caulobacteraceae bacterium]
MRRLAILACIGALAAWPGTAAAVVHHPHARHARRVHHLRRRPARAPAPGLRVWSLSAADKAQIEQETALPARPASPVADAPGLALQGELGRRGHASLGMHSLESESEVDDGALSAAARAMRRPADDVAGAQVNVGF